MRWLTIPTFSRHGASMCSRRTFLLVASLWNVSLRAVGFRLPGNVRTTVICIGQAGSSPLSIASSAMGEALTKGSEAASPSNQAHGDQGIRTAAAYIEILDVFNLDGWSCCV